MPWCPKCKNEYKKGVKICADCGCELVEEQILQKPLTFGEKEDMEALADFLTFHKITDAHIEFDENEQVYELFVPEKDLELAAKLRSVYVQEISKRMKDEKEEEESPIKPSALYENNASKAEENKSSAYTLLFVGIIGSILVFCGIFGILPIRLGATSKYMLYGIMGVMFLLFIVMGLISMKSYHVFTKKAESENTIRDSIKKWCKETINAEELDNELFSDGEDLPEEEKYFKRTALLKNKISNQFLNLDESFLDSLADELYEDIFT